MRKVMKFLIADDEKRNRILMERILAPFGRCDLAINGQEAVEAFELAMLDREPYDLVCLDIMMPEMDGQEALRQIRATEQKLAAHHDSAEPPSMSRIFMVTAMDIREEVIEAFFHGGCTDYLVKPITRDRILDKMREHDLVRE